MGTSPPEPDPNQDNRFECRPLTEPEAEAARAVIAIAGAADAGAAETDATNGATDTGESLLTAGVLTAAVDASAGAETVGISAGFALVERDPLLPAEAAGAGEVSSEL